MQNNQKYNDMLNRISQIMKNLAQGTMSSVPQDAFPTSQAMPKVQNEILQKQNRLERLILGYSMERDVSSVSKLRDLSPEARKTQTFTASTIPSQILEEQFLASKSTKGRQLTSITQLTNKELDELEKAFKKLTEAISKGRKEVNIFSSSYDETMRGASRSVGGGIDRKPFTQSLKDSGYFASATALAKGLEQGNLLATGAGAMGTILGAGGIATKTLGLAGGAAVAGTAALSVAAILAAGTYAGSQIAQKHMLENAQSSLGASQLQQAIGGGSYTGGVGALGVTKDYAGNMEFARLKALEIMSGGTVDINQMLGVMGLAAGRTDISGQRGGALATTLAQYGGAGVGIEAFSNAVDKFSKIADHSKLVNVIEAVPEIMSRGGGTVTAETVAGLTDLAYQIKYGKGIDTEDKTAETLTGLRGTMLLLGAMGIEKDANQLQMMRGVTGGIKSMAGTSAGRGFLFGATGKIEHALFPEGIMEDPEALADLINNSITVANTIGLRGSTAKATEAMQRDLFMNMSGGSKDFAQLAMTIQKSGERITPEKLEEIRATSLSEGDTIKTRSDKAQRGAGVAQEVSIHSKTEETIGAINSMTQELGDLVELLKSTSEKTKQITVRSATIVVGSLTPGERSSNPYGT